MVTHWQEWHRGYDDPASSLSRRLEEVRRAIRASLDAAPVGRLSVVSLCCGDGRDLIGELSTHPRAADVDALLVDMDEALIHVANNEVDRHGLGGVRAVVGDAGLTSFVQEMAPVHLMLVCGIFGNIEADDVHNTIQTLSVLAAPEGDVVWTRHRRPPDQTGQIRSWFAESGFTERSFVTVTDSLASVGRHTLDAVTPPSGAIADRLFTFRGNGVDAVY